jgi:hypothetical protein
MGIGHWGDGGGRGDEEDGGDLMNITSSLFPIACSLFPIPFSLTDI